MFANLSLSSPGDCGGGHVDPNAWCIGAEAMELPYFPEKWLAEWLQGCPTSAAGTPVYAFAKTSVQPLKVAYRKLLKLYPVDLVVLVDGGTGSVNFGDEPGLGTIVEDAVSLVAAVRSTGNGTMLAALGFGIDNFHGVSHHSFLKNAARLSRDGDYLGGLALVRGTPEADTLLDFVDYANLRQSHYCSIVCNSIASALQGDYGDHRVTDRTSGTQVIINPLMTHYWAFKAERVVDHMEFAAALAATRAFAEASGAIELQRGFLDPKPLRSIPL